MSSQQSGFVAGNKQNEPGGKTPHSRSRFQLSDSMFVTERFADYNPCFVLEGVSGDKITLNQPHQVRTYTLKAPLMQNLLKKKDFFMVPMQAILPNNWEKFYTNPVIGDDVPLGVGTGVPNFWGRLLTVFKADLNSLYTTINGSGTDETKIHDMLLFLVFYEMFYSAGSLMKQLRIGGNAFVSLLKGTLFPTDYDGFFDEAIAGLTSYSGNAPCYFFLTVGSKMYQVALAGVSIGQIGTEAGGYPCISIRECLELIRDDLNFTISSVTFPTGFTPFASSNVLNTLFYSIGVNPNFSVPSAPSSNPDFHEDGVPLNLARLWAYQICVAHYYSNDHIDVLYSAELYRQYIRSLYVTVLGTTSISSGANVFTYNGVKYEWDSLSSAVFNFFFSQSIQFTVAFRSVFVHNASTLAYFVSLFGFKKSLRFMDYFTGARSQPLAVGDATVDVNSGTPNYVDILDLARSTQATRFLNAVNRSGRKFSAYMQELFGIVPKPDFHNPFYLSHTSDVVGGSETENTGADQLTKQSSITTILRSNASRYAFTFSPDRDCVIIGISYYDLPRVYTKATDRQNFYLDRMDMFNPLMQYIGDQPIFNAELGTPLPDLSPFAYTTRDMEYKQRFNMAAGGFVARSTQLGDWFFSADKLRRWFGLNIGSSFIRSFNSEFDQFYVNLTGWSLGTYFHFIVRYDNRCDASRPMAYAPGIMQ